MFRREQIGYGWLGVMYAGEDANGRSLRMFPIRRLSSLMREEIQYRHRLMASKPILKAFPALGIQMVHGTPYWIGGWKNGVLLSVAIEEYRMPFQVLFAIAVQILESLWDAKQKGCIHGDLDPKCIWLTTNGEVWIEGYGQKIHHDIPNRFSDMAYVAPSGLAHSASDVYSLGAILIHALLQKKPMIAADDEDIHRLHVRQLYEQLKQLDIPKNFAQQLARLIGFQADKRPSIERVLSKWSIKDSDIVIASWLREVFPYMYLPGRPEERIPQASTSPQKTLQVDLNHSEKSFAKPDTESPFGGKQHTNQEIWPIQEEWDLEAFPQPVQLKNTPSKHGPKISSNQRIEIDAKSLKIPENFDLSGHSFQNFPLDKEISPIIDDHQTFLGEDTINLDDLSIDFQDLGQLNDDVFANVNPSFGEDFFQQDSEDTVVLDGNLDDILVQSSMEKPPESTSDAESDVLADDDTFIMQKPSPRGSSQSHKSNNQVEDTLEDIMEETMEETMEVPVFKNEPEYSLEDEFFFETTQCLVEDTQPESHLDMEEEGEVPAWKNWISTTIFSRDIINKRNMIFFTMLGGLGLVVVMIKVLLASPQDEGKENLENMAIQDEASKTVQQNPQSNDEVIGDQVIEDEVIEDQVIEDDTRNSETTDATVEKPAQIHEPTNEPEQKPVVERQSKSSKPQISQKSMETKNVAKTSAQSDQRKNSSQSGSAQKAEKELAPKINEPMIEIVEEEVKPVQTPIVVPKGRVALKGDVGSIRLYKHGKDYTIHQPLEVGEYELYVKFDTWQEMSMGKIKIQENQTVQIRCDGTMKICKVL